MKYEHSAMLSRIKKEKTKLKITNVDLAEMARSAYNMISAKTPKNIGFKRFFILFINSEVRLLTTSIYNMIVRLIVRY